MKTWVTYLATIFLATWLFVFEIYAAEKTISGTTISGTTISGTTISGTTISGTTISGTTLIYVEEEAGIDPVTSRFFINKEFLRISGDASPDDFILFKRAEQTIYNVTQSDRTILVISAKPVSVASPIKLDLEEQLQASAGFPKVGGQEVKHYRYRVNGTLCYDAAVLPTNFLPEVAKALYEFKQVLAGEHATTVNSIPTSMLNDCDIALNVFHAGEYLKQGIPVREWAPEGYQRYLKDYVLESVLPETAFKLPDDYRRYAIGDILKSNGN